MSQLWRDWWKRETTDGVYSFQNCSIFSQTRWSGGSSPSASIALETASASSIGSLSIRSKVHPHSKAIADIMLPQLGTSSFSECCIVECHPKKRLPLNSLTTGSGITSLTSAAYLIISSFFCLSFVWFRSKSQTQKTSIEKPRASAITLCIFCFPPTATKCPPDLRNSASIFFFFIYASKSATSSAPSTSTTLPAKNTSAMLVCKERSMPDSAAAGPIGSAPFRIAQ